MNKEKKYSVSFFFGAYLQKYSRLNMSCVRSTHFRHSQYSCHAVVFVASCLVESSPKDIQYFSIHFSVLLSFSQDVVAIITSQICQNGMRAKILYHSVFFFLANLQNIQCLICHVYCLVTAEVINVHVMQYYVQFFVIAV